VQALASSDLETEMSTMPVVDDWEVLLAYITCHKFVYVVRLCWRFVEMMCVLNWQDGC